MKFLLSVCLTFICCSFIQGQTFNRAFTQGGDLGSEEGIKVTTDAHGNIYQLIQYDSAFYIDSAGSPLLIKSNNNALHADGAIGRYGVRVPGSELALIKFDSSGHYQWHLFIDMVGGWGEENLFSFFSLGLKTDGGGDIYLSGSLYIYDSVNFISSNGTVALRLVVSPNSFNGMGGESRNKFAFLLKAGNTGIIQWVNTMRIDSIIDLTSTDAQLYSGWNQCQDLAIDASGSVYVHLLYSRKVIVNSQDGTEHVFYDTSYQGSRIIKYDANGVYQPLNQLSTKLGYLATNVYGLVSDNTGNIYALLEYDVPFSIAIDTLDAPNRPLELMDRQYIVAKLDAGGNWVWANALFNGTSTNPILAINKKGDRIFVGHTYSGSNFYSESGLYSGTPFGCNGGTDMLVSCMDDSGNELWTHTFGGTGLDTLCGIAVNTKEEVFLLGITNSSSLNFGNSQVNTPTNQSIFVSQFDSSANNIGTQSIHGKLGMYQLSASGALHITDKNRGYFTGWFYDSVTIGCNTIRSKGNADAFIIEYLAGYDTLFIDTCSPYVSPSHRYTWKNSGFYLDTIQSVYGCDSILHIQLTLNNTSDSIGKTFCRSYMAPSGKYFYQSGTYYDTIPNSKNCDSIITITLISNQSTDTLLVNSCTPYTSPSGKHLYTQTGQYMDTVSNSKSCDSILIIHFTRLILTDTISITSCSTYTSPSGKHVYSAPGTYIDTLSGSGGCDSILTINFTLSKPVIKATKSGNIDCIQTSVTLTAEGASTYVWSPAISLSDPGSSTTIASPVSAITYTVTGKDSNGCTASDSVHIDVVLTGLIHLLPNVFTPNGDGINDCFTIDSPEIIKTVNFSVFNRWGTQVFYTANPEGCWDGKNEGGEPVADATYFFVIEGTSTCNSRFKLHGTVQVIR